MANVGGTGTAEAAVCHVSPQNGVTGPGYFRTSFAGVYDAAACGNVNSSQFLRKQPFKSPLRVRFSKKPPDVVLVPIPGVCNLSQQCYRGKSDWTHKNYSPRRGLSDPVNDEQAILSDIAGGRARARALRLAASVSGIESSRSIITWLPGRLWLWILQCRIRSPLTLTGMCMKSK